MARLRGIWTTKMPPKNKKSPYAAAASSTPNPTAVPVQRISWPPLYLPPPLIRSTHLTLDPLLPDQIYLIPSFFPASLCNTYTRFLCTLPLATTPSKPKRGEAVRVNDRFQINDPGLAKELWVGTGLAELITGVGVEFEDGEGSPKGKVANKQAMEQRWGGEVVGLSPNIRIYRYGKGQFFDKHYDESNVLQLPIAQGQKQTKCHTTYTLLLYLTAPPEVAGGETIFYHELPKQPGKKGSGGTDVIKVELAKGMALLHKHGRDCLLHEGAIVTDGEKWVLRTDLVVRG